MRIGLGPVFAYEWLRTSRNWRMYAVRVLFGLTLLAVLGLVAMSNADSQRGGVPEIRQQAEAGRAFSAAILATQLSLLLLVAPAATAGAVCQDKQRGTLAHVLVTDLNSAELVLGKLAARLWPAIALMFATMGVTAICTLMGGIDPMGLLGGFLVSLGCTVLAGTIALTISVWAGKTHEVLMATYLVLTAWLLLYPGWLLLAAVGMVAGNPAWLEPSNPFVLVAEVRPGAVPLHQHALFLVACLGLSVVLTGLATWRIRSVAARQLNRVPRARKGRAARSERRWRSPLRILAPSLDRNPVLWREWHRRRPSRWSRAIWSAYTAASLGATALGVFLLSNTPGRGRAEITMIFVNGLQVAVGLLLLSVTAATALAEERARGSLDVLLATPLPTRAILWGKWWGAFRTVPFLAVLPGVIALAAVMVYLPQVASANWRASPMAALAGRGLGVVLIVGLTLAYGAAITSFGLAMATWIPRLDRAVAATVAAYVFILVAWSFLIYMLFQDDNINGPGLCSASPFMGIAFTGSLIVDAYNPIDSQWEAQMAWATFWILAHVTIAAILLKATLVSFDRQLGRIPDGGLPIPPRPPGIEAPVPAAEPIAV